MDYLSFIKGVVRRWYRKKFHKKWDVIKQGFYIFQEFAEIYGNTINNLETAERFFQDFMKQTKGLVIVDFLDADNWDCIRKIEIDKQNRLIWFYWQVPSGGIEETIRRNVFPLDYYGMCLKFDSVSFMKDGHNTCFAIVVNGYTIGENKIKKIAQYDGWEIKRIDSRSNLFMTNVVREKSGAFQYWSFINTPISSFWIIPKCLKVYPQDSEKYLYMFGIEKCEKKLKVAYDKIKRLYKLRNEEQRTKIKAVANSMRNVAECLFKLIMCYYQAKYQYKAGDYDKLTLGKLTGPLKNSIYKQESERKLIRYITEKANDLSHDSGNPIDIDDLYVLFRYISYFISDFKSRIMKEEHEIIDTRTDRPSPHDFVKNEYKSFCFKDEINEVVHKDIRNISFIIKAQIGTFVSIFDRNKGDEVLCRDGYIRDSKENGIAILKLGDRDEVIALLEKMRRKVIAECEANGFDTGVHSLGISFEAKLKKEGTPNHLFTESEIKELMRKADDQKINKLVIDEDGYAQIIQDPSLGGLYPVTQEAWAAGNMYVGKDSNLSDLHDSYVLCMHLWLEYLRTGQHMYDDVYISDDGLDRVIKEVNKYYLSKGA